MQQTGTEIIIVIAAGTALLLMLVVFLFIFIMLYQKRKIKEQERHHLLIESNQEKVMAAILETQEEERKRIARDLHDELGNALAIAKMNLGQLTRDFTGPESQETASQTYSIIEDTLKNLRRLSKNLHPVMLEKYGLASAIEALGKNCASDNLAISIKTSGEFTGLPANQELNVFRIVQELLSNALKHSQATVLKLSLESNPQQLIMHYQDNGCGFEYQNFPLQSSKPKAGLGMLTIDARVRVLKGSWHLESPAGKGTTATFRFPVIS